MNRLRQMAIFAHIVEQHSLSKAAEKLGLSKSVVSQHLKTLEQTIGLTLIKRTTRKQTLTTAGQEFYLRCQAMNQLADEAWQQTQHHHLEPQGKCRLTIAHGFIDVIAPVLANLMIKYPKLNIELICEDNPLDLIHHDIDLAIRIGPSPDSNIKQQRIGQFRDVLCGAKSHNKLKQTTKINDISQFNYIANAWQGRHIHHIFTNIDGHTSEFTQTAGCVTNNYHSALALIKAGAGIGIIPDFCFAQQQGLINLLPDHQLPINQVYALNPYTSHPPMAVRVLIEAIKENLFL